MVLMAPTLMAWLAVASLLPKRQILEGRPRFLSGFLGPMLRAQKILWVAHGVEAAVPGVTTAREEIFRRGLGSASHSSARLT